MRKHYVTGKKKKLAYEECKTIRDEFYYQNAIQTNPTLQLK